MSNVSRRAEGALQMLAGKLEGAIGRLFGNGRMRIEGKALEMSGAAKRATAKASARAQGTVEEVVGGVQRGAGNVLNDDVLRAKGAFNEIKGRGRQDLNR